MSDLVVDPEGRFSRVAAHLILVQGCFDLNAPTKPCVGLCNRWAALWVTFMIYGGYGVGLA